MIVYRILENGYFGGMSIYPDDSGIPYGTTRTPVPDIPEGYYAIWAGTEWNLTTVPPFDIMPEPSPIPDVQVVSMRQARRILFQHGYLDDVDAYINQLISPDKEFAQIDWEYAIEVHKQSELVQHIATALNISSTTIDQLFFEASQISL